jgi:hypothetical protein
MNTTTTAPPDPTDVARVAPDVLDDHARAAYVLVGQLRGIGPNAAGLIDALLDVVDDLAEQALPRFVIVENPTSFGGDDCDVGYEVIDRNLAQPDSTIGAVVLRGNFLEARAVASMANADPKSWDDALIDNEIGF